MPLDLKRGIVRILAADGATTSGTGFLLSEKCIIVTCSHVVQAEKLQVRGYPRLGGRRTPRMWHFFSWRGRCLMVWSLCLWAARKVQRAINSRASAFPIRARRRGSMEKVS